MAFKDLFKDNNDINEKSVVGFASFIVMIIFALVDIITGIYGKEIVLHLKRLPTHLCGSVCQPKSRSCQEFP